MTFKNGDLVRIKANGYQGILEEINPRVDFDPTDEYWAVVRDPEFHTFELDGPDDIELVMSAADAANRKVPSKREVLNAIDFTGGWGDDLNIQQSEVSGDTATIYGETGDGLRFVAEIVVVMVEEESL